MATILAVDDDRTSQVTLRELLENLGYEVHLASALEPALRVLRHGVPVDLVVLRTRTLGRYPAELALPLDEARPGMAFVLAGDDATSLALAQREGKAAGLLVTPFEAAAVERELTRVLSGASRARPPDHAPARSASTLSPPAGGVPAPPAPPAPAAAAARPVPAAAAPRGPVVLVAEDNDILRGAMLRVLRGAGLEVLEAASGEDAVRVAAAPGRIDLLVTDVLMPGMTGTDLADRLSRDRAALKVLFVSGYPSDASVAAAARRAPTGVLQKPFRHTVLLEHVQRLLA